jgi:hypothetical protein
VLIKITNQCSMGCGHCMEDSVPNGPHMSEDTFRRSLEFTRSAEAAAWRLGVPPLVLLSGGECSEHPEFVKFIELVEQAKMQPLLITNGMWLGDEKLRAEVLRPKRDIFVQVTNDARYYPSKPPIVRDPRITYVDSLTLLLPLGRLARKKGERALPTRKAPSSFNLRSATRSLGSFFAAISTLRVRAAGGFSGHCIPSISDDGSVMAGETRNCWKLGTVDSSDAALTQAVLDMGACNRCGLENNLTREQKLAIGL